jgi:hypothetical protein
MLSPRCLSLLAGAHLTLLLSVLFNPTTIADAVSALDEHVRAGRRVITLASRLLSEEEVSRIEHWALTAEGGEREEATLRGLLPLLSSNSFNSK